MSFFGMGSMEIVVIVIIALIIFGPGKLPEVSGQAGKMLRDFRRATRDLTSEFQESTDDVQTTMNEMKSTVSDMKRETEEIAASIPAAVDDGVGKPLTRASGTLRRAPHTNYGSGGNEEQTDVPIAEASAPVATRNDPFADLIELEDTADGTARLGSSG